MLSMLWRRGCCELWEFAKCLKFDMVVVGFGDSGTFDYMILVSTSSASTVLIKFEFYR